MRILRVDAAAPEPAAVAAAAKVLARGGLVAFPTETVYGIAADAGDAGAVGRLYAAKGRDASKLCALLLPDRASAARHAPPLPPFAARLADAFWPGPVTLVVPGHGGATVGLRLPSAPVALALARAAGRPLLQTSANPSGAPAAVNAAGVAATLEGRVDLLLDGGRCPQGRSSTVVACDAARFRVLRGGAVPAAAVVEAASELTLAVCTGNLCRSPTAAALLRRAAAEELGCADEEVVWHGHRFGSFGTLAVAGMPATDEAVAVAAELGVDVAAHRSRPFSLELAAAARRVFWLAADHREFLLPYFAERPEDLAPLRPDGRDVPDPVGRSLAVYRGAGKEIADACRARAAELLAPEETSA